MKYSRSRSELRVKRGSHFMSEKGVRQVQGELFAKLSELTQQKNELNEINSTLKIIIEASPCPIVELNYEGKVLSWSNAAEKVFGWSASEILGKPCPVVLGPVHPLSGPILKRLIRGDTINSTEVVCYKKSGQPVRISISAAPIKNYLDETGRIILVMMDITQQHQAAKKFRDSVVRYIRLFHSINDSVIIYKISEKGIPIQITEANKTACDRLGYRHNELLALSPLSIIDPECSGKLIALFKNTPSDKPIRCQINQIRKDGSRVPVDINARLFHLDGEAFILSVARDKIGKVDTEKALKYRLQIEHAVAEVSSMLVKSNAPNLDDILRVLAEAVGISRSYLFQFCDNYHRMNNTHEWCAPGTEPQIGLMHDMEITGFKWWLGKLKNNECVVINNLSEIPVYATEEITSLRAQGVISFLEVPINVHGELFGFLGFNDITEPRIWNRSDVELLRIGAEALGSYYERINREENMQHISNYDKLSGLLNRSSFEEELRRYNSNQFIPFCITMIDINDMQAINDLLGYDIGDRVISSTAQILKNTLRQADVIGRWSGDDFIILSRGINEEGAKIISSRIKTAFSGVKINGVEINVAVGTAVKTTVAQDIKEIVKSAEDNLQMNKIVFSKRARSTNIASLNRSLLEKSNETEEHAQRLQDLSIKFGKALNLSNGDLDKLALASLLHDIGKIAVPETILNKPGRLSKNEFEAIKKHSEIGYRIAESSVALSSVAEIILHHHERWDGSGYPKGLKQDEIPILARIVSIVDAFDAMTNDRPYRKELSIGEALQELSRCKGTHFDPYLVRRFFEVIAFDMNGMVDERVDIRG